MKVLILTEGGSSKGLGHITRCFSLYQAFEQFNIKPEFYIMCDVDLGSVLVGIEYTVYNWHNEICNLLNPLNKYDIIIIDSYEISLDLYNYINEYTKLCIYFDDYNRLNYPSGIIINGCIDAEKINYPKEKTKSYLLGSYFQPLRKEFWNVPDKNISEKVKKILITLGGSDIRNLMPKLVSSMINEFKNFEIIMLLGNGYTKKDYNEINNVANKNCTIISSIDASSLMKIMLDVDIAVSASGQTLFELATVGVPTIAISIVDNQQLNISSWEAAGFIENAGWWEDRLLLKSVNDLIYKLMDKYSRLAKYNLAKSIVDGKGSLNIVTYIIKRISEIH